MGNNGLGKWDYLGMIPNPNFNNDHTSGSSEAFDSSNPDGLEEGPCCCRINGILTMREPTVQEIQSCLEVKVIVSKEYLYGLYYRWQDIEVSAPGKLPSDRGVLIVVHYGWKKDADCPCISELASKNCHSTSVRSGFKYKYDDETENFHAHRAANPHEDIAVLTQNAPYAFVRDFEGTSGKIHNGPITSMPLSNVRNLQSVNIFVRAKYEQVLSLDYTFESGANIPPRR